MGAHLYTRYVISRPEFYDGHTLLLKANNVHDIVSYDWELSQNKFRAQRANAYLEPVVSRKHSSKHIYIKNKAKARAYQLH
jgi:hypothetical protein